MSTTPPAPRRALTEDTATTSTLPTPAGQGAPVPDRPAQGRPVPSTGSNGATLRHRVDRHARARGECDS